MFTEEEKKVLRKAGRVGGKKTVEKYGKDHFKRMQQKSVEARRKNKALKNKKEKELSTVEPLQ